ncbi:DUF732 domain-containing protein [Mycobacterium talmoniae]|uniref:Lipoprotein LprJ n=1 Tax=Mycobacterium talmoniae TaxID=1858794 RepID=A0A1S1MX81_9MYCO|nr:MULTISPECIES: DUF732 domain-containing protein [Mycobacterium]OHU92367.1 hypothetical protein BKN37_24980 [Mycobacterium talmoniae]PQM44926.1 Putative lipoprotein LprJ [Mycobacterium talmoniae]TDH50559.1 DUF732 domain-containing protein [Mycobacterium eburneum]
MPTLTNFRRWLARTLALSVALAAAFAAPARADAIDDSFLSALDGAGVNYGGDPQSAVALGQSICPALVQPGATAASAASGITGNGGMSPAMAQLFTGIAISMYCPSMVDSLAEGQVPNLPQLPGMPAL